MHIVEGKCIVDAFSEATLLGEDFPQFPSCGRGGATLTLTRLFMFGLTPFGQTPFGLTPIGIGLTQSSRKCCCAVTA